MKNEKAKAILAEIRELDREIRDSHGKALARLINKRATLVIKYIAALGHGILLALIRG